METKTIIDLLNGYTPYDETKPEKEIIPRFITVIYQLIEGTGKLPNEIALQAVYPDYSLGVIKYNLQRSVRNLHLCLMLSESEEQLPPIAVSGGSADFIMGNIPFAICLTEKQYDSLSEEYRNSVNCIVLEDYKEKIETVNGFVLYKDISGTILNVAQKIEEMIQRAQEESKEQEDAEGSNTEDTVSQEGE